MSFLDDIFNNDESLSSNTASSDKVIFDLVRAAALSGNLEGLRSAVDRGQLDQNTPFELVLDIVGIAGAAGDKLSRKDIDALPQKIAFIEEWVNITTPNDPAIRQERLDALLSACYHDYNKFHDDVAGKLVQMGANPLSPTVQTPVALDSGQTIVNKMFAGADRADVDPSVPGRVIGIIGTAGRDKEQKFDLETWEQMLADCRARVRPNDHAVSGGAAWADHLAVMMFLEGRIKELTLHLPAPMNDKNQFEGPFKSAGSAANYYHEKFEAVAGYSSLDQIRDAIDHGANVTYQPVAPGVGAMFTRNKIVAQQVNDAGDRGAVLAYTYGEGDKPADGGTKNTWDQIKASEKIHVPMAMMGLDNEAGKTINYDETQGLNMGGARFGLLSVKSTAFADAIYTNSSHIKAMAAAVDPNATVATLRRFGKEVDVNAAAFAVAMGPVRATDTILAGFKGKSTSAAYDKALGQLMELGLHEFGGDEVHHDMGKLLAAGAAGDNVSRLAKETMIIIQSPCMMYRNVNGQIIDGEKPVEGDNLNKAMVSTFAGALLTTPDAGVTAKALKNLVEHGYNINGPVLSKLPEQENPSKSVQLTAGASIMHLAALRGDQLVFSELAGLGGKTKALDTNGNTPADYAYAGLNRALTFFMDTEYGTKLQAAENKNPMLNGLNIATGLMLAYDLDLPNVHKHEPKLHKAKGAVKATVVDDLEAIQAELDAAAKLDALNTYVDPDEDRDITPDPVVQKTVETVATAAIAKEVTPKYQEPVKEAAPVAVPAKTAEPEPAPTPAAPAEPAKSATRKPRNVAAQSLFSRLRKSDDVIDPQSVVESAPNPAPTTEQNKEAVSRAAAAKARIPSSVKLHNAFKPGN